MQSLIDSKVKPMPLNKPRSSCLLILAFSFVASEAAATSEEMIYKPNQPLKPIVEPQAAKQEPAKKEEKEYVYDPAGKTDPFKSFIAEQEEMAEKQKRKPRTYLETLDLSQLELIAIITGPQGNYAMVRDSKGVGHVIVKGTTVGTNGGVVDKITEREVIIREEYRDFRGSTKFKDVSKKLPSII
jgi:type IV pilus assembly protein PilP